MRIINDEDNVKEEEIICDFENGFKPANIKDQTKNVSKVINQRFVITIVVIVVTLIAIGVISTCCISCSIADVDAKAQKSSTRIAKLEDKYKEQVEDELNNANNLLAKKYDYDDYIEEMSKLSDLKDILDQEDWYNPYSNEHSTYYKDSCDNIERLINSLKMRVGDDLLSKLDSYKIDGNLFENGKLKDDVNDDVIRKLDIVNNSDNETLSKSIFDACNGLETTYNDIVNNQLKYSIFDEEKMNENIENYNNIKHNIYEIYYAISDKEKTEKAVEEANKEFNSKKEELTKKITEEVERKLNSENSAEISTLQKKIESLESENKKLSSDYDSLKKQYDELKRKK